MAANEVRSFYSRQAHTGAPRRMSSGKKCNRNKRDDPLTPTDLKHTHTRTHTHTRCKLVGLSRLGPAVRQHARQSGKDVGKEQRAGEDERRSEPMCDGEGVVEVGDRDEQREEFAQRYDERHGQRRTFGRQHKHCTYAHVSSARHRVKASSVTTCIQNTLLLHHRQEIFPRADWLFKPALAK